MTMKHSQVEDQQIIERYVRNQLDDDQRNEFQAHFFDCDECFTNLQTTERFIAGVQYGAETGLITDDLTKPVSLAYGRRWFKPAFGITAFATLVLTAVVAWLALVRLPELRDQVMRERNAYADLEIRKQREIDELNGRLAKQPTSDGQRIGSEDTILQSKTDRKTGSAASDLIAHNVPLVVLEAARGADDANQIKLSPNTSRFACWIEVGPSEQSQNFRVEVFDESGTLLALVSEIRKNGKGAVVVTFAAQKFSSGEYRIRLYRLPKSDSSLIGDYKLHIDR